MALELTNRVRDSTQRCERKCDAAQDDKEKICTSSAFAASAASTLASGPGGLLRMEGYWKLGRIRARLNFVPNKSLSRSTFSTPPCAFPGEPGSLLTYRVWLDVSAFSLVNTVPMYVSPSSALRSCLRNLSLFGISILGLAYPREARRVVMHSSSIDESRISQLTPSPDL